MMKKRIICLAVMMLLFVQSIIPAFAADVPDEAVPCIATGESVEIVESLASDIFDLVKQGLGYADAKSMASKRIFNAVVSNQTNGYGFGALSVIANNTIFQYRDMYLRPEYYAEMELRVQALIADIINDVKNGKDYAAAKKEAYAKIRQSVNPSFDPESCTMTDFCYWDMPPVDSAMFQIARRLLLNAQNDN